MIGYTTNDRAALEGMELSHAGELQEEALEWAACRQRLIEAFMPLDFALCVAFRMPQLTLAPRSVVASDPHSETGRVR